MQYFSCHGLPNQEADKQWDCSSIHPYQKISSTLQISAYPRCFIIWSALLEYVSLSVGEFKNVICLMK